MKIDSYSFGRMKVEGKEYTNDLIIYPDKIETDWWRKEGHSLCLDDLKDVIGYKPDCLIVGQGANSQMSVPGQIKNRLEEKGIKVLSGPTEKMYKIFNQYIEKGKKVAGAFHLTC